MKKYFNRSLYLGTELYVPGKAQSFVGLNPHHAQNKNSLQIYKTHAQTIGSLSLPLLELLEGDPRPRSPGKHGLLAVENHADQTRPLLVTGDVQTNVTVHERSGRVGGARVLNDTTQPRG